MYSKGEEQLTARKCLRWLRLSPSVTFALEILKLNFLETLKLTVLEKIYVNNSAVCLLFRRLMSTIVHFISCTLQYR